MIKLKKVIVSTLAAATILSLNPIAAHAEWEQNNQGWWYAEGNSSYATGWKQIGGNWYYFYSDGYMAQNVTIDGCYVNSYGVWESQLNEIINRELIKNVSVQNPSFYIQCPSSGVSIKDIGSIVEHEKNKLKITNSYETFNLSSIDLNSSRYGKGPITIKVDCTYNMSAEMEAALDAKAREIVASIAPSGMSQTEQELAIHDWIVNNTRYDQSYSIHDPYTTLFRHTGVCEGYALLAQKMFTIAGIKSMVVEGTADGVSHAWNLVYINNKWRHVDCTWDDPVSSEDILSHDYYNLTDSEISTSHTWNTSVYPSAN